VEAGVAQVEAHGVERVGERVGFRDKDLRAARARLGRDEHSGGAIAEQNRGDEIGLGNVLALKGE